METKPRLILAALISSVMVLLVTFLVAVLDLGWRAGVLNRRVKAYVLTWPIAAITAFFIIPPARPLTERVAALIDGLR
jgi:Protein of unknown function (DUF2798)